MVPGSNSVKYTKHHIPHWSYYIPIMIPGNRKGATTVAMAMSYHLRVIVHYEVHKYIIFYLDVGSAKCYIVKRS